MVNSCESPFIHPSILKEAQAHYIYQQIYLQEDEHKKRREGHRAEGKQRQAEGKELQGNAVS